MVGNRFFTAGVATLCILLMSTSVVLVELFILRETEHREAIVRAGLLDTGALIAQDIQKDIASCIFVTETLHVLLKTTGYNITDFDGWGRQLAASRCTVQLAPKGIVSYIYPLKGNEAAMGHDLLKDKRRNDGAIKAIQSKKLTFVGPLKLIQNGKYAVIARQPIFKSTEQGEEFWGFSIAILLVDDILSDWLQDIERQGVLVKIEGSDPDAAAPPTFFVSSGWDAAESASTVSMPIIVPNGEWILKLKRTPHSYPYYNFFRIAIFLLALIVSIYIFFQQRQLRARQLEIVNLNKRLLELSMTDELTGVGNRRACMQILEFQIEQAQRYGQRLTVAMVDLDFFKKINDDHGHWVGDQLLRHVASAFVDFARKSDFIFRLGGDEFLLLFPQAGLEDGLKAIRKFLNHLAKTPCTLDTSVLFAELSIGVAEYERGEGVKSLLQRADNKLYEAKETGRGCIKC